jgi:hypothetical protein
MTDSSVAIVAAVSAVGGAVLAALITAVVTYKVTSRSVGAAAVEADANRKHESTLAWTERDQERKLDAYQSITRHIGHWTRQIQWAMNKDSFEMVPPLPQPTSDSVDFASEALSALVGSEPVWKAVREFNQLVTDYLVSVGSARQLDSFISDAEPKSKDVAAAAHLKARADGQATISAGEAAIVTMREELHRTRSYGE